MTKRVLIFDFDGTIADTHHYIIGIYNRLSSDFQYNLIREEEIENLKDKSSRELIRYLKIPITKIPSIITRGKKEFYKNVLTVKPIAGLADILQRLKGTSATMGILSSNASENIDQFLSLHNLNIFDFVYTTPKVWSKNIILNKLIKTYAFETDHTLYIGDETRDIVAAQRSGIKIAAVTWGYNSSKALKECRPDFLINTPEELFEVCTSASIIRRVHEERF